MSKSNFYTEDRVRELIETIRAEGARKKGIRKFASKYGLGEGAVRSYFYTRVLTPELNETLPRAGMATTGKKQLVTIEQALREVLKRKGDTPLTKEDVEAAAQKAGVHYHVALSAWGNMVQKGEAAISGIRCGDKNCLWLKGMAFASLLDSGITSAELAKVTGLSPAEVRELAKTYRAFPNPGDREPSLTFFHHLIAAGAENPRQWLEKARDAGWSTREMSAAVKGEPVLGTGFLKEENTKLRAAIDFLLAMLRKNGIKINGQWLKDTGIPLNTERLAALGLLFEDRKSNGKTVERFKPGKPNIVVSPPAEGLVSLEYITGLHNRISCLEDEIAALKNQLTAARKVGVSALRMLQSKNRMNTRFISGTPSREHVHVLN